MKLLPNQPPLVSTKGYRLAQFAHNDSEILFHHITPTIDSLVRQYIKGIYDPMLASKAFQRVAEEAAIMYGKQLRSEKSATADKTTSFSPQDYEDAGKHLLVMNIHLIEEGIKKNLKIEGKNRARTTNSR